MTTTEGAVTLPRWFVWLQSILMPIVVGIAAVATTYLGFINANIQELRERMVRVETLIELKEDRLE